MRRRLVLSHQGRERYLELAPGERALIGRSPDARLFLSEPSISRQHCLLRGTETGVEVEDLGSRNACFVDGRRVVTRAMLQDGGVLQVGSVPFSVSFLDEGPLVVRCPVCGRDVPAAELGRSESGEACASCFARLADTRRPQAVAAIESQGFIVREALGGNPPTFVVEREGVGKTFVVEVVELPAADVLRVAQLREDARALAALDHPAIVTVFDQFEVGRCLLLVLAHETGEPLEALVRRAGPLPAQAALAMARTCAQAVRHAHSKNVVHGEVTPRNVVLGEERQVRLASFPLARELAKLSFSYSGTDEADRLLYLAPEVLRGVANLGPRADIFGIGAVLVFALTARSPWGPDANPRDHVRAVLGETAPSPALEGVPAPLVPVLAALLSPDPQARPVSADAALALLDAAGRDLAR